MTTLTIIKLAVWLVTVDDVEAVRNGRLHGTDLKVEPLMILSIVDVRVEDQIIFIPGSQSTTTESETSMRYKIGLFDSTNWQNPWNINSHIRAMIHS